MINNDSLKCYACEFIGTFALVFFGTGAIVVNSEFGQGAALSHLGIATAFGLVILVMIYSLGEISGAHFNPAVSVAFASVGKFPWVQVIPYVVSQIAGAFAGSLLVKLSLPAHETLGATLPASDTMSVFVLEFFLTFLLMFVICNVALGSKEQGLMAGLSIGGTVMLCALVYGPVTGASMNPARSLAPAIVSGKLTALWVYITAPVIGAVVASFTWYWITPTDEA